MLNWVKFLIRDAKMILHIMVLLKEIPPKRKANTQHGEKRVGWVETGRKKTGEFRTAGP